MDQDQDLLKQEAIRPILLAHLCLIDMVLHLMAIWVHLHMLGIGLPNTHQGDLRVMVDPDYNNLDHPLPPNLTRGIPTTDQHQMPDYLFM